MTTFEHAMLGINGTLAAGLHRRYQWRVVALAGLAAVAPDWDGLTIIGGMELFDHAHRAWGHSFFSCVILACCIAALDYRFDLVGYGERMLCWVLRTPSTASVTRQEGSHQRLVAWMLVAILATMSHLAADLVYSGTAELSDWHLQLLWPFSTQGFVFPMVHWGDAGVTIIFVVSMFAMVRRRDRIQPIALITLTLVLVYIVVRGTLLS
ncbi:MAG: metal-dependent hydrolase [Planctomycetes bacterium]|nr:metal-dependent hydrolase [Planctomycetota bacterium]